VLIHPGVAEAGRTEAGPAFQEAVDAELAATWQMVMQRGLENYGRDPMAGAMILRAGLAGFPYLSRRREWGTASAMLDETTLRDTSPATLAAVLPRLRRIVEATAGTERELSDRGLLARILQRTGRRDEAEQEFRSVIEEAEIRGEFLTASVNASELVIPLRRSGRLDDALAAVEQAIDFARRAALGPWTLLGREGQRLQIQVQRGEYDLVARRVSELREQMKSMPDPPGPNETVNAWNVRELVLDIGRAAALRLAEWQQALDFNAEHLASKQSRDAPELEQARTLFNDYGPLLSLRRYDQARALLLACQAIFERESSVEMIGMVLSARADLEARLDYPAQAKSLELAALRYEYIQGEPDSAEISHFNLDNYLLEAGEPREALAHRLVAAMIAVATSSGRAPENLGRLAADIRASGEGRAALPEDFDALSKLVEQVEGVRFGELMRRVVGDAAACDPLFQTVVKAAVEVASQNGEETKGMNENADFADVARHAADRLAPSLDQGLRAAVEQELARDPLETPSERVFEPISFAAFVVSLASFGWTVYRDLKKDRDAAKADPRETEARLALLLREDESFASGHLPAGMTSEQQSLILTAVAAEIVAADPP
jgi:hypothetical protein